MRRLQMEMLLVQDGSDAAAGEVDGAGQAEQPADTTGLTSLLESWDVETYLEQGRGRGRSLVCQYYSKTGSCPYQELGCMLPHSQVRLGWTCNSNWSSRLGRPGGRRAAAVRRRRRRRR